MRNGNLDQVFSAGTTHVVTSGSQSARHAVDSALPRAGLDMSEHLWTLWRRGKKTTGPWSRVGMLSPVFGGAPCQF